MRGAFIFAIATFVAPILTAAVPVIGQTTSFHVETAVKRDTEIFNADQLKSRNLPERSTVIGTVLGTEDLDKRTRRVNWPRDGTEPTEALIERRGRVKWNQKRNPEVSESPVEPRGRVKWNQKREPESSESPVERRGRVKWNQ